ncbi:DUF4838 domain-containing protein [Sphingobacterium sp. N143]|uniref:DUF4838 domain-containing protein n=1 Tax=Sphingobacterium sp. N143 TaxID=2746727 RepID=UPI00257495CF|nr:DUF4838 domain-containing protein [Sphingobacterium sp. N143]MDM1293262.1 DUF4838 domain-containing protein [Sphingobacterium sp. N143]
MWKYTLVFLLMATMAHGRERITLVEKGKSNFVLQFDQNDPVLLKAAQIINDFTEQCTGAIFVFGSGNMSKPSIILKQLPIDQTYPADSYSIAFRSGHLYIQGSGKGVLYGAYRYVRTIIGARKWFTGKEDTFVPKLTSLAVDADLSIFAKPSFQFRELYFPVELDQEYMDWYGLHNLEEKWGAWGHTFNKIIPPAIYFKEHPEYYALYNGTRQPIQLCLSNEAVFELTVAYFKEQMLENPAAAYWSIAPNDDIGHCTCDRCQAIDKREGGPQGSLIHFVNQVAARFPDKQFTTLAYVQTANAPSHLHVADNVTVILSNIDAFRNDDIQKENSAAIFRRQLRDWKAKAKHIFVWDYLTQFTNYLAPFPIQGTMQKNLYYLQSQGVEGVFLQGGGTAYSDMAELNAYILAHLVWDTDLSEEDLIDEFVNGYYGQAGPFVKAYLVARRNHLFNASSALSIYGNPIDNRADFLSPKAMDEYSRLLEKAEAAIEGDQRLEKRIRRIGLGLDYAYLQQARFYGPRQHGIFEEKDGQWITRPKVKHKVNKFITDVKKIGLTELAEGGPSPDKYAQEWEDIFNTGFRINKAANALVTLKYPFDTSFPANGVRTLTDSVPGYLDYSYNWLLWNGDPMDIELNFKDGQQMDSITVNFLQDARHWIFAPEEVRIAVSMDGRSFQEVLSDRTETVDEDYTVQKVKFSAQIAGHVKIVRVYAKPLSKLPVWRHHPSRKPMIACDEIWIE